MFEATQTNHIILVVVDSTFRLTVGGEMEPGEGADRFMANDLMNTATASRGRRGTSWMKGGLQPEAISHLQKARFNKVGVIQVVSHLRVRDVALLHFVKNKIDKVEDERDTRGSKDDISA